MQKTLVIPARARPLAFSPQALLPYILWALLTAGLTELLLFRMLSRVGVHIPKEGAVQDGYNLLTGAGSYAFNVATVLAFAAVVLLAHSLAVSRARVPAALVSALAALSLLFAFIEESAGARFAYGLVSAAVMVVLAADAWAGGRKDVPRRLIVTLVVAAYLASQYGTLANHAYRALGIGGSVPGSIGTLEASEALVVAVAFAMFWAWSGLREEGWRWRPPLLHIAAAAVVAVVFLGAYAGENSSTAAILSLWTLGLTLYLPLPLYVLALALYVLTFAACIRNPLRTNEALALGLLPVAGLTLEMTYQHLLAVAAVLLLARAVAVEQAVSAETSA
ncbi:MAG: hypothetical protein HYS09_00085 [Chloroflexi bacterium]|nr:hypothetical protein [Chloroflexota bacterium]